MLFFSVEIFIPFNTRSLKHFSTHNSSQFTDHRSPITAHRSQVTVYWFQLTVHWSPFSVHRLVKRSDEGT